LIIRRLRQTPAYYVAGFAPASM